MTNTNATSTTLRRRPFQCAFCVLDGRQQLDDHASFEVRDWKRNCGARVNQMCDAYRGRKSDMPCVVCRAIDVYQICNADGCNRIVAICYDCADARAAFRLAVESGYCASHIDDSEVDWDWRADYDLPARLGFGDDPSKIAVELTHDEMNVASRKGRPNTRLFPEKIGVADVFTPVEVRRVGVEGTREQIQALLDRLLEGDGKRTMMDHEDGVIMPPETMIFVSTVQKLRDALDAAAPAPVLDGAPAPDADAEAPVEVEESISVRLTNQQASYLRHICEGEIDFDALRAGHRRVGIVGTRAQIEEVQALVLRSIQRMRLSGSTGYSAVLGVAEQIVENIELDIAHADKEKVDGLTGQSGYFVRIAKSIRAAYHRDITLTSNDFHYLHGEACARVLRDRRDRTDAAIDAENDVLSQAGWIAERLFGIDQTDDQWYDITTFESHHMTAILDVMCGESVSIDDWRASTKRWELMRERESATATADAAPAAEGASVTFVEDVDGKPIVHVMDRPKGMIGYVRDDGGRAASGRKGSASDCVARAVAIYFGTPYDQAYRRVADANRRLSLDGVASARIGVDPRITEHVLAMHGMRKVRFPDRSRPTLSEAYRLFGDCIIRIPRHITTIVDGKLRDTWDLRMQNAKSQRKVKAVFVMDSARIPEGYSLVPMRQRKRRIAAPRRTIQFNNGYVLRRIRETLEWRGTDLDPSIRIDDRRLRVIGRDDRLRALINDIGEFGDWIRWQSDWPEWKRKARSRKVFALWGYMRDAMHGAMQDASSPAVPRRYYLRLPDSECHALRSHVDWLEEHGASRGIDFVGMLDGNAGIDVSREDLDALQRMLEEYVPYLPSNEAWRTDDDDLLESLLNRIRQFRDDLTRGFDGRSGPMVPECTACLEFRRKEAPRPIEGLAGLCLADGCTSWSAICQPCSDEYPEVLWIVQQGYCARHKSRAIPPDGAAAPADAVSVEWNADVALTARQARKVHDFLELTDSYGVHHPEEMFSIEDLDIQIDDDSDSGLLRCDRRQARALVIMLNAWTELIEMHRGEDDALAVEVRDELAGLLATGYQMAVMLGGEFDPDSSMNFYGDYIRGEMYDMELPIALTSTECERLHEIGKHADYRCHVMGCDLRRIHEHYVNPNDGVCDLADALFRDKGAVYLSVETWCLLRHKVERHLAWLDRQSAFFVDAIQSEVPVAIMRKIDDALGVELDGASGDGKRKSRRAVIHLNELQSQAFDVTRQLIDEAKSNMGKIDPYYYQHLAGIDLSKLTFRWNLPSGRIDADGNALATLVAVQERRVQHQLQLVGSGLGHVIRSQKAILRKMRVALASMPNGREIAVPRIPVVLDSLDEEVRLLARVLREIEERPHTQLRTAIVIAVTEIMPGRHTGASMKGIVDALDTRVMGEHRSRNIGRAGALREIIRQMLRQIDKDDRRAAARDRRHAWTLDGDAGPPSDAPRFSDMVPDRQCLTCDKWIPNTASTKKRFCSRNCRQRYGYHRRKLNKRQQDADNGESSENA